jgi:apolipoprotein N-acyltransferase
MDKLRRHRRSLSAIAGGLMAASALPPTDFYPGMFMALAFLAYAVHDVPSGRRGFAIGWLWGTCGGLFGLRFVPSVIQLFTSLGDVAAYAAHVLLSAAQSLNWGFGMLLSTLLMRRGRIPAEVALPAGVLLAVSMPSVFLWTPAGLLSEWPRILQTGELIGERGVSALFALVGALLARAAWRWREGAAGRATLRPLLVAGALLGLLALHGTLAMQRYTDATGDADRLRVGLVHASVDPKYRWVRKNRPLILEELKKHTRAAEREGVQLSIWPEAAYPYPLMHGAKRMGPSRRSVLGRGVRGPVLFGLIMIDQARRNADGLTVQDRFNSATLVTPKGELSPSYDKMELLAFGEAVPLGEQIPWLKRTFQRSGGLIPGREARAIELDRGAQGSARMMVLNCYEDTSPALGRRLAAELSPHLLVNVTNDAWFIGTVEPVLHLRLSAMRSIELRRDLVRSVNLGIAAWIDAAGRVRASNDGKTPGHMVVTPTLRNEPPTIYARFGDWPMIAMLVAAAAAWRRRDPAGTGARVGAGTGGGTGARAGTRARVGTGAGAAVGTGQLTRSATQLHQRHPPPRQHQ